jgi:hypothetical protein
MFSGESAAMMNVAFSYPVDKALRANTIPALRRK